MSARFSPSLPKKLWAKNRTAYADGMKADQSANLFPTGLAESRCGRAEDLTLEPSFFREQPAFHAFDRRTTSACRSATRSQSYIPGRAKKSGSWSLEEHLSGGKDGNSQEQISRQGLRQARSEWFRATTAGRSLRTPGKDQLIRAWKAKSISLGVRVRRWGKR